MSYILEKDWITAAGLRAVVVIALRNGRKTHRCGYVGVEPDSPLFGAKYYEQLPSIQQETVDKCSLGKKSPILGLTACCSGDTEGAVRRSPDILFDVHGGLTYSDSGNYPVSSNLWWFGFDCSHSGDGEIQPNPSYGFLLSGEVRSLAYVEAECESLAAQIADFHAEVASCS